jgi:hypothetical protein
MELILKYSYLVVLGFLILHGQLMKKISLFYTCQFNFLPRLGESLINLGLNELEVVLHAR